MDLDITIAGVTPLLMHKFSDTDQLRATEGVALASANTERGTAYEQAAAGIYYDEGGVIVLPQPNLLRCLMEGGRYFKVGKRQVTTQRESLIPACVDILAVAMKLQYAEPWTVDTRPVRIPSTGGRILRHRARFDDWQVSFALSLDTEILGPTLLREVVDAAGKRVGLGDFRPACKGPFGRFVVTRWMPHAA
jgi:hypothetical protein